MWDLANGKLLRTITDAHPPGTAILHVKVYKKYTQREMCEMYGYRVFFLIFICVCVCSLQMTQLLQCAMTVEDQCLSWRSGKSYRNPIYINLMLLGVNGELIFIKYQFTEK